jgi:hypothetical protein
VLELVTMRALVLSALLLAAIPAFAPATAENTPWVLSQDGIGPVHIGMNTDQVERIVHTKMGYNQYRNHGCSTMTTKELEPLGISFMIEAKHLSRVNVDFYGTDPRPLAIKTDAGIGLGSSEEDVLKAYPAARIKPDPADPTWHTIIVESPDRTRGLVFYTNGKTVKSMRGGINPAISYPNGCN